ncbi:MAG: DinB family protein [Gemmatimonadales bacterium]
MSELQSSRKQVVNALGGVSQAQWTFKAGPTRWSIAEVAEHIVKAEAFIGAVVRTSLLADPADTIKALQRRPSNAALDAHALAAIRDRTKKAEAPAPIVPIGLYKTPREAIDAFNRARDSTIAYVLTTHDDLRDHFSSQITGSELDGVEGLLTLSGHAERHVAQIDEVKRSAGYPPK